MSKKLPVTSRKPGSRRYRIAEPGKAPAVAEIGSLPLARQLTAVFEKVPLGYIGHVEEVPGANSQGRTLQETKANLREAVVLVLEANRQLAEEALIGRKVIREPLGGILA